MKTVFYDVVFAPVMDILRKANPQTKQLGNELTNASISALLHAIRSGLVQYTDGVFSGQFSVSISRDLRGMGGSLDARSSVYRVPIERVPDVVRVEAARYQSVAKAAHDEVQRHLNEIQSEIEKVVAEHPIDAEETIRRIDKGFARSAELLEVHPKLSSDRVEELAEDYNKNIQLYIVDFSKQSIQALREAVENNALQGYRFDRLTEMIRHRYGVTANKAKFLARQETGLYMAKYRKQRFDQAGVTRYRWSTAHDERVRDSHKHLNGSVFSYSHPPITDRSTGARNNPGEDFNCRCVDIPILEKDPAFI